MSARWSLVVAVSVVSTFAIVAQAQETTTVNTHWNTTEAAERLQERLIENDFVIVEAERAGPGFRAVAERADVSNTGWINCQSDSMDPVAMTIEISGKQWQRGGGSGGTTVDLTPSLSRNGEPAGDCTLTDEAMRGLRSAL